MDVSHYYSIVLPLRTRIYAQGLTAIALGLFMANHLVIPLIGLISKYPFIKIDAAPSGGMDDYYELHFFG